LRLSDPPEARKSDPLLSIRYDSYTLCGEQAIFRTSFSTLLQNAWLAI
jgi:hypothetical protein